MTLVNAKSYVTGTDVWWLGCVMTSNENLMEVTISFLQSRGPSPSDMYAQQPDILSIPLSEVLMKVDQRKATGQS
jgi:hypothetical protein